MSPARKAIMQLIRTADARNYSPTYKEALRTALAAVERAELEAARPPAPGPTVIYEQRERPDVSRTVVEWDEVSGL